MVSSRTALLTALGADNAGSGLFLPVALLYVTRDVGLPLAVAGTVVALGTVAGLAVPPLAGHLGDRIGPRRVVVGAELLQALGAVTYLAARGAAAVTAAAVLLAAGQQLFYSSLFALISDVAGDGPKDRPFAVAAMVRSACFGLGGLAAAGLLSVAGPGAYRIAVAVDAVSFAVCALLLALLVRTPAPSRPGGAAAGGGPTRLRAGPALPGPDRDHRAGRAAHGLLPQRHLRLPARGPAGAALAARRGAGPGDRAEQRRRHRRTAGPPPYAAHHGHGAGRGAVCGLECGQPGRPGRAVRLAARGDRGRSRGHGGGGGAVSVTGQPGGRGG